jgi:dihydrofolate synthase/folylpolyglutamate synthase
MPQSVQRVADELNAPLLRLGKEFGFETTLHDWSWWMRYGNQSFELQALPLPAIGGAIQTQNAALSLATVQLLNQQRPVARAAIEQGLRNVRLPGRFDCISSTRTPGVTWILDVAHNPMSAAILATHLHSYARSKRRTIAVFGMLSDKDVAGTIHALSAQVDEWIAVGLSGTRALSNIKLSELLNECGVSIVGSADNVVAGCELASQRASAGDCIVVCGSFMTVAPAMQWLNTPK